ncbi:MAG: PEGA domain-containing protein [Candidatus Doudnabacteria bacterium]|nr:PEGA domain-containing protein [Candidatus Doudnabacteria bacterium]
MKLRNRFLLVGFGVVVFLVATPILVLFTRGYQVDWANHRFVKTGVFVVKTLPTKAVVYLDNKKIKGNTPETIRFVLPGDYDVRVEKDGYQSWTKRLHIQAQLATWINFDRDFITLFKSQTQSLESASANFSSISKNGGELAYVHNDLLYIYNVSNQTTQNLGDISGNSLPYTFSSNLEWTNATQVLALFSQNKPPITFDPKTIQKVISDGKYLLIVSNGQIFTSKDNNLKFIDKQITGAALDGENLWYIQNRTLKQYNLRTESVATVLENLSPSSIASITRGDGNTFLILDNSLYTINDGLEKIYDGVNFANYDTSAHKLLFANNNEVLVYNPAQKNTELIVRSISPVTHPLLNSYTGYVFFVNENKIKAIELDGRDHRNVYTIQNLTDSNSNFTLNSEGSVLTIFSDSKVESFSIR